MAGCQIKFVAFLAIIQSVFANVPTLIWNTRNIDVRVPPVSALQQISVPSLLARHLDSFQPTNIVLFLQDALSVEDLSSHEAELSHVNKWVEKAGQSLYLPNVLEPAQLSHDLVHQGYKVTKLTPGSAISELKLEPNAKNLVIVKLPPTITNPKRSRALQKADEVMDSVLSKIGEMADFTVIYTGMKSSMENAHNNAGRVRVARSLQPSFRTEELPPNFHRTDCVAMYIRKNLTIIYTGEGGGAFPLPEKTVIETNGDCGTNNSIVLTYADLELNEHLYRLKVMFIFNNIGGYYSSRQAQLQLTFDDNRSKVEKKYLKLDSFEDNSVPLGKSFSCNAPIRYVEANKTANETGIILLVEGIQVQAFMHNNTMSFGPSWDCVGFFSIGVWAGLLVTLLMVIILSCGMYALSDIKTMDRFDDPKGKTIVVPQSSE